MQRILMLLLLAAGVATAMVVPAAATNTNEAWAESEFLRLINERRAELSLAPLDSHWDLVDDAREHSRFQSEGRCGGGERICHNPELGSVTSDWYALGENVGVGYDVAGLDRAFWNSEVHRANVVGNFNYAGVGVVIRDDGTLFVTVVFMRGDPGLSATPEPPAYDFPAGADRIGVHDAVRGTWSLYGEPASFYYGVPSDVPVACDWDGDGQATVGLYRSTTGYLYLRNTNEFGVADLDMFYGIPEDVPLCGDWDGDGLETIGIYRPDDGTFYLRNSNSLGFADGEIRFGAEGDIPLAGDWFGDGHASVGVFRPSTGMLYLADGGLELGNVLALPRTGILPGDELVAGDWTGDGADSLGYLRPDTGEFHLLLGLEPDAEAAVVVLGPGSPVAGSWG